MGLLSWIIFGALAGWMAGLITGTSGRRGCLTNILVGVVGAFLGGLLMQAITGEGISFAFNLHSFVVAVVGAVLLLAVAGVARGKDKR